LNGVADQVSTGATGAPCWVKVKRAGDTIAGYASLNGKDGTEVYSTSVPGLPSTVFVGYGVTSEVSGKLVTAVFDKGPVTASDPIPADKAGDARVFKGNQFMATYRPETLSANTTYYWRVDEVNAAAADSPWKGNVWSFTTANFLVVDDFESYTNEIGERVFQSWLDGAGYTEPQVVRGNNTGAIVWHDIWTESSPYYGGPIVESRIVHGGGQSMPVDYNNAISPYYSEVERTWVAPHNWTVKGMNMLVLYVRGAAANAPARLYVALQDNATHVAVVPHSDPATISATEWVEWKIPLADFTGVNPAAVRECHRTLVVPGIATGYAPFASGTAGGFVSMS